MTTRNLLTLSFLPESSVGALPIHTEILILAIPKRVHFFGSILTRDQFYTLVCTSLACILTTLIQDLFPADWQEECRPWNESHSHTQTRAAPLRWAAQWIWLSVSNDPVVCGAFSLLQKGFVCERAKKECHFNMRTWSSIFLENSLCSEGARRCAVYGYFDCVFQCFCCYWESCLATEFKKRWRLCLRASWV